MERLYVRTPAGNISKTYIENQQLRVLFLLSPTGLCSSPPVSSNPRWIREPRQKAGRTAEIIVSF